MGKNEYKVENVDEARTALVKFATGYSGMSYAFVTDDNGVLKVHERTQQPCYGEMRPYGKTHPDMLPEHQRGVSKPGDLHSPFPKTGNPVMAVLCMYSPVQGWDAEARAGLDDFLALYLDKDRSPWKHATADAELLEDNGRPIGILFNNTKIMPTVLVEGWMFLRSVFHANKFRLWNMLRKMFSDANPNELLLFWYGFYSYDSNKTFTQAWGEYYLSPFLEVSRFLEGNPVLDGPTFYERGAYNRPYLHDVFGHGKSNILQRYRKASGKNSITAAELPEAFTIFQKALVS